MTAKQQRIAIAGVCGFELEGKWSVPIPDFLNDLNAMHEAEKTLSGHYLQFEAELKEVCIRDWRNGTQDYYSESFHCHSTAAQRAEAFLRCKGLWKDETQPLSVGKEPSVG